MTKHCSKVSCFGGADIRISDHRRIFLIRTVHAHRHTSLKGLRVVALRGVVLLGLAASSEKVIGAYNAMEGLGWTMLGCDLKGTTQPCLCGVRC